jgi:hypothetical protein
MIPKVRKLARSARKMPARRRRYKGEADDVALWIREWHQDERTDVRDLIT